MEKRIVVIGAGISGLATAYWLEKSGFEVALLEAKGEPGGAMETQIEDGFLIDFGPNSGLETTPLISQLAEEVGIKDEMIYANEEGENRYILKNNALLPLPTSPIAFFRSKLFSLPAKLRLMQEPFIGKSEDGYYQSISEFVTRRLGREFLDYAIDPFVSGVFAGDPNKLSVKSAFPKLYRLEELYGGLIMGMIKGAKERKKRNEQSKQNAKMFSFKNGMQTFPAAIANKLKGKIHYHSSVNEIIKTDYGYKIVYTQNGERAEIDTPRILSTIPSHTLSNKIKSIDSKLSAHLAEIFYPKVMVMFLGFNKSSIGQKLDGFGYLIPTKENKIFLGAIWSSTIFKNRSEDDKASFTIFIGGAKSSNPLSENNDTIIREVISEFKNTMRISEEPLMVKTKLWDKAIPQYNLGYIEHEKYFEQFELNNPGFYLSGNYRGGISVGDCVKNSEVTAKRIIES
ncbi:MAG: protoporphyrinogen oxidase [Bacteroidetes bacterium]|nr:protoporphyrinogen oxidase [Bacteroidota bacterium]